MLVINALFDSALYSPVASTSPGRGFEQARTKLPAALEKGGSGQPPLTFSQVVDRPAGVWCVPTPYWYMHVQKVCMSYSRNDAKFRSKQLNQKGLRRVQHLFCVHCVYFTYWSMDDSAAKDGDNLFGFLFAKIQATSPT